jgi:opacity protein-like surface antigen
MERENEKLNELPRKSKPTMNALTRGDWFFGISPSVSFLLAYSDYNDIHYPYFNKKPISNTFIDASLGYQFNKKGIVTALSYRNPKFTNEAFGTKQIIQKNSVVLEVYKFLTDYSGFTPYVGVGLGFNKIDYSEKSIVKDISISKNMVSPGIVMGWDILPGKTEQWFVLRTNLRWFPFEKLNINNKTFSLNQIEYNVIQAVIYPSRYKNARSKRDENRKK